MVGSLSPSVQYPHSLPSKNSWAGIDRVPASQSCRQFSSSMCTLLLSCQLDSLPFSYPFSLFLSTLYFFILEQFLNLIFFYIIHNVHSLKCLYSSGPRKGQAGYPVCRTKSPTSVSHLGWPDLSKVLPQAQQDVKKQSPQLFQSQGVYIPNENSQGHLYL